MNTKNTVNIKREIEIKREKLNKLILNEVEYDLILKHSIELDKILNTYNEYLGWGNCSN